MGIRFVVIWAIPEPTGLRLEEVGRLWLYENLKLFNGYRVRRLSTPKALPA